MGGALVGGGGAIGGDGGGGAGGAAELLCLLDGLTFSLNFTVLSLFSPFLGESVTEVVFDPETLFALLTSPDSVMLPRSC